MNIQNVQKNNNNNNKRIDENKMLKKQKKNTTTERYEYLMKSTKLKKEIRCANLKYKRGKRMNESLCKSNKSI